MHTKFWTNWQNADRRLEPDVRRLGRSGWTLPLWADPRIVANLAGTAADIDAWFVQYYIRGKASNLRSLWAALLNSRRMGRWRGVLREAIASYEDRRYAVVLPALLLTFEAAVSAGAKDLRQPVSSPTKSATRTQHATPAGMRRLIWVSLTAFLEQVFGSARFDEKRPITLNRHWLMHGREAKAWARRRDCIRLFHALGTVAATVDRVR